jgi:hypothetical protein
MMSFASIFLWEHKEPKFEEEIPMKRQTAARTFAKAFRPSIQSNVA